jgi:WD40 repeat protein
METSGIVGPSYQYNVMVAMKLAAALALAVLADSSHRREFVDPEKFVLLGQYGPSRGSTLSPAGNAFAVYAANDAVLFDAKDGRELRVLRGHAANIHDSGWSRDGRVFATSGYDGVVKVWEVATGRVLASVTPHTGYA